MIVLIKQIQHYDLMLSILTRCDKQGIEKFSTLIWFKLFGIFVKSKELTISDLFDEHIQNRNIEFKTVA